MSTTPKKSAACEQAKWNCLQSCKNDVAFKNPERKKKCKQKCIKNYKNCDLLDPVTPEKYIFSKDTSTNKPITEENDMSSNTSEIEIFPEYTSTNKTITEENDILYASETDNEEVPSIPTRRDSKMSKLKTIQSINKDINDEFLKFLIDTEKKKINKKEDIIKKYKKWINGSTPIEEKDRFFLNNELKKNKEDYYKVKDSIIVEEDSFLGYLNTFINNVSLFDDETIQQNKPPQTPKKYAISNKYSSSKEFIQFLINNIKKEIRNYNKNIETYTSYMNKINTLSPVKKQKLEQLYNEKKEEYDNYISLKNKPFASYIVTNGFYQSFSFGKHAFNYGCGTNKHAFNYGCGMNTNVKRFSYGCGKQRFGEESSNLDVRLDII